jgi:hypothetical protein
MSIIKKDGAASHKLALQGAPPQSSLSGLTRQSMRPRRMFNPASCLLHVSMDHRVKPGGDEKRDGLCAHRLRPDKAPAMTWGLA